MSKCFISWAEYQLHYCEQYQPDYDYSATPADSKDGEPKEIAALICSACLLLWRARDRFLSATGFRGLIVKDWLLSSQFPPKGSQQALFSCFLLEMYWETEILCNAAMWYSNLQAIYWTLWFRLAWRSKVTFLKALSCLCSIVETQSFTRSQHQVCWFSMAAWCTWELQFHSQCTYHKFTPKKKSFPYIYRARMLPCLRLYF